MPTCFITLLSCCVQQTTELQLNLRIAQQFQWILEKALSCWLRDPETSHSCRYASWSQARAEQEHQFTVGKISQITALEQFLGVFFLCWKHSQPSGRDSYFGRQSEDQRNMPWLTSVVAIVHMIVFIMTMWHNNCPANIVVIPVAADYWSLPFCWEASSLYWQRPYC